MNNDLDIINEYLNPRYRNNINIGDFVFIVKKEDQQSGKLTKGVVKKILTNSNYHPRGIKVLLVSGDVGRVQKIIKKV